MSPSYFARLTGMTFETLGVALASGQPTSGTAEESYPWCTQGSILRCYYMTREQCEESVDYHGFCVANPDVPTQRPAPKGPPGVRPGAIRAHR
jgi:hypothetical protein